MAMISLDRMHIGQKLAVIGALVALLFLAPTLLLLAKIGDDLGRARRATAGLDHALAIVSLQRAASEHRAHAAAMLAGQADSTPAVQAARRDVDERLAKVMAAVTDGAALSSRRLGAAAATWKSLAEAAAAKVISPLDSLQRHAELAGQLQDGLEALVDERGLSADSAMAVNHAVGAAFRQAPRLAEALGQAHALAARMLAARAGEPEDKQAAAAAVDQARERMTRLAADTGKAVERDAAMREPVTAALQALDAEVAKAVRATRVDVVFSQTLDSGTARHGAAMSAALDANGRMIAALAGESRRVLDARNATLWREIVLAIIGAIIAITIATSIAWWMARSIVRPLFFAVSVADGIAAGRLDHPIDTRRARSLEVKRLLGAFAAMQASLSHLAREIQGSSREIHQAAGQVAQGNTELSSRTEEQASSLEETAATMEELTATVGANSGNAQRAAEVVAHADEAARRGGDAVQAAVGTMEQINAASKRIADITAAIDTIAFQTNILALNAAVEAARAGEQGRGFAVVAAEVRNLAQRAGASAREIKEIVRESAAAAAQGTSRVADTGRAMEEIMESVGQVSSLFTEISAASAEQGHGIQQVNRAISQMDRVTQENAALVNEAAASSQALQSQAARLAELAQRFRTGDAGAAELAEAVPGTVRLGRAESRAAPRLLRETHGTA
jgi:methyl-accepting chemotaxis protein